MPVDVFVELVAMGRKHVAEGQLRRPVSPSQEALIGVAKIGFGIHDNASQGFEDLALRVHGAPDLRLPWQPQVFEHADAHAFEAAVPERLCKRSAWLVN